MVRIASFSAARKAFSLARAIMRRAASGALRLMKPIGRPTASVRRCAKLFASRQAIARLKSSVSSRVSRAGMTSMEDISPSLSRSSFPVRDSAI